MVQWIIPKSVESQYNASSYIQIDLLEGQTEKDVKTFFESFDKGELKDRIVQEASLTNRSFKVDKVFRVSSNLLNQMRNEAVVQWGSLRKHSWSILAVQGILVVSAYVSAFYFDRWYLIVASLVMTVFGCATGGIVWGSYSQADREFQTLEKPEQDFLRRRDKALEASVPVIFTNQDRFGLNKKNGTLTDLEVLFLWKKEFKDFAEKYLKEDPQDEAGKKRWLDFFIMNVPLAQDFFKQDPAVLDVKGWERVREFQERLDNSSLVPGDEFYLDYKAARQFLQEAKSALIDGKEIQKNPVAPVAPTSTVSTSTSTTSLSLEPEADDNVEFFDPDEEVEIPTNVSPESDDDVEFYNPDEAENVSSDEEEFESFGSDKE